MIGLLILTRLGHYSWFVYLYWIFLFKFVTVIVKLLIVRTWCCSSHLSPSIAFQHLAYFSRSCASCTAGIIIKHPIQGLLLCIVILGLRRSLSLHLPLSSPFSEVNFHLLCTFVRIFASQVNSASFNQMALCIAIIVLVTFCAIILVNVVLLIPGHWMILSHRLSDTLHNQHGRCYSPSMCDSCLPTPCIHKISSFSS